MGKSKEKRRKAKLCSLNERLIKMEKEPKSRMKGWPRKMCLITVFRACADKQEAVRVRFLHSNDGNSAVCSDVCLVTSTLSLSLEKCKRKC